MKVKLWFALLLWGDAAFSPLPILAVLLWVVLLSHPSLVRCCVSPGWCGLLLPPVGWCCFPPSSSFGVVVPSLPRPPLGGAAGLLPPLGSATFLLLLWVVACSLFLLGGAVFSSLLLGVSFLPFGCCLLSPSSLWVVLSSSASFRWCCRSPL